MFHHTSQIIIIINFSKTSSFLHVQLTVNTQYMHRTVLILLPGFLGLTDCPVKI